MSNLQCLCVACGALYSEIARQSLFDGYDCGYWGEGSEVTSFHLEELVDMGWSYCYLLSPD